MTYTPYRYWNGCVLTPIPGLDPEPLEHALKWAQAEAELEEATGVLANWDQTSWCGTSHCVGGEIAARAGWELLSRDGAQCSRGDETLPVDIAARRALGLTAEYALDVSPLWSGSNTLLDLFRMAHVFTDGAIEVPAELEEGRAVATLRPDEPVHEILPF